MLPYLFLAWMACAAPPATEPLPRLESFDLSADGNWLFGMGDDKLIQYDLRERRIHATRPLGHVSHMAILRISADGRRLFFSNGSTLYVAEVHKQGIGTPQIIPLTGQVWLNLQVNHDGSEVSASVDANDYVVGGDRQCSPGRRYIVRLRRQGESYAATYLGEDTPPCQFMDGALMLPDGGLAYHLHYSKTPLEDGLYIAEALPEGGWQHTRVGPEAQRPCLRPGTNRGSFISYRFDADESCAIFLHERDSSGQWTQQRVSPNRDGQCAGPWLTGISPSGEQLLWLNFKRNAQQGYDEEAFWSRSRRPDGTWEAPRRLVDVSHLGQLWELSVSERNAVFSNTSGQCYLIDALDGSAQLHALH